ncbi:hypothetical protein LBMAG42_53680 [Deltaproteobacteria bacterium]|nr:hypothetical protein LBMAG42_53680 [Deltaproteobacteria bacterium]
MFALMIAAAFAGEAASEPTAPAPESTPVPAPAPAPESAPAPVPAPVAGPVAAPVAPIEVTVQRPPEPKYQIDVSVAGTVFESDPYGSLSNGGLTSAGIRGSYRVNRWLVPFAGLSYTDATMSHIVTSDDELGSTTFRTGLYQTQMFLGAKPTWAPNKYVGVYGLVQAQGLLGIVRLDDDPDDDENLGQIEGEGFAFGGTFGAGVEAFAPTGGPLQIAFSFELGYSAYAPLQLEDVATIDASGVSLRTGVGVRF